MTRWEYAVYQLNVKESDREESILNEFGNEGWELVCINDEGPYGNNKYTYYFKRPK